MSFSLFIGRSILALWREDGQWRRQNKNTGRGGRKWRYIQWRHTTRGV